MATLRWRPTRDRSRRLASIIWKVKGVQHTHPLGVSDPVLAEAMFAQWRQEHGIPGPSAPRGGLEEAREAFLSAIAVGAPSKMSRVFHEAKLDGLIAGLGSDWVQWTPAAVSALIARKDWGATTTRMHLSMGRRFVKWARAQGYPCPDFVGALKAPRVRRTLPKILEPGQMRRLLNQAQREENRLELAVHLACRGQSKGDIRTLDWKEVSVRKRRIHRQRGREKSGEDLPIPIEGRLLALLEAVPRKDRVGRVVKAFSENPLSGNEDRDLRALCKRAKVPKGGWHKLRHGWATMLYAEGVDVPTIGRLLGHAPGSPVTLRYIQPQWEALRQAVLKGERVLAVGGRKPGA